MPGAENFLKQAYAQGLTLGVGTSSQTKKAIELLSKAGLAHFFKVIVGSDKVELAKPAPDIYFLTISKLNKSPKECLIIDDSLNGIKAALQTGAKVIQYCSGSLDKHSDTDLSSIDKTTDFETIFRMISCR